MKGVDYSYYYEQENDISEDEGWARLRQLRNEIFTLF
jgi:hypothetical protein